MQAEKPIIEINYSGEIVAKGRPRFYNGSAITPKKTRVFETNLAQMAWSQFLGSPLMEGQLRVDIVFRIKAPKVTKFMYPPRPDLDNLIKCLDALNGIIWKDDAQIVSINASKVFSQSPGLNLKIWEAPEIFRKPTPEEMAIEAEMRT